MPTTSCPIWWRWPTGCRWCRWRPRSTPSSAPASGPASWRASNAKASRDAPTGLPRLLDEMDAEMRHGTKLLTSSAIQRGDEASLQAIDSFVAQQRPAMVDLATRVNGPAQSKVTDSIVLLDKMTA